MKVTYRHTEFTTQGRNPKTYKKKVFDLPENLSFRETEPPDGVELSENEVWVEILDELKVEKWRIEAVLKETGLYEQVEAFIDQSPEIVQSAWNNNALINRWSKTIEQVRVHLNLTHEQATEMFLQAKNIDI